MGPSFRTHAIYNGLGVSQGQDIATGNCSFINLTYAFQFLDAVCCSLSCQHGIQEINSAARGFLFPDNLFYFSYGSVCCHSVCTFLEVSNAGSSRPPS